MPRGLYIHFPFCVSKCPYCDFNSRLSSREEHDRWNKLVIREIQTRCISGESFDTLFIGGGTPTILSRNLFLELIGNLKKYLDLSRLCEFSIEANPSSLNAELIRTYRENGVTRISIGVQSFHDPLLKILGRIHTASQAEACLEATCAAGFSVSADLMFGVPGQISAQVVRDVNRALDFQISHLSLYGMTIEKNTPFFERKKNKQLPKIDTGNYDKMYFQAAEILESRGFKRYEVSSFAKSGHECVHNKNYWNHSDYVGAGPGAHSLLQGMRLSSPTELDDYDLWINDGCPIGGFGVDILSDEVMYDEAVWLGLRTIKGINLELLKSKFHRTPAEKKLNLWIQREVMRECPAGTYSLAGRGWAYLDEITADLLSS